MRDTVVIDTDTLPSGAAYAVARVTPLARDALGEPFVILLDLPAGEVVPPHTAPSGIRLVTVQRGAVHWGDGETVDPARERVFPQGTIFTIRAGDCHWLAARDGDVRLQLVVMANDAPVPGIQEQLT